MMRLAAVLTIYCLLTACATLPPPPAIDYDTNLWAVPNGTAIITGQSMIKKPDGTMTSCVNYPVILFPDSPYAEWLAASFARNGEVLTSETDSRVNIGSRRTICDANGYFAFYNLPAGDWIVMTAGPASLLGPARKAVFNKVTTIDGQETIVDVGAQ